MAKQIDHEYDVIIIGAGTSGCVLANRLSEDPNLAVLVLEAGEDRSADPRTYTPGHTGSVLNDADFDWQYASQPEPGLNNKILRHPRGRIVGGTSAINSLSLIYPSAAGIDAWQELGNEGWNWKTLGPYFRKFQSITQPSQEVKDQLNLAHSEDSIRESNGPIQASFPMRVTPLRKSWDDAFRNLGLQNKSDPLDGMAIGGHTCTNHVSSDRERSHAGNAYLEPVVSRSNLTVITAAQVSKLLIEQDENGPVVHGVSYTVGTDTHSVLARREVLLTAGTFNTPQLLELSGIGNPDILQQHGIDVIVANPAVGENLQDHIKCVISFEAKSGVPVFGATLTNEEHEEYEKDRSGRLADAGAFSFSYTPLVPFLNQDEINDLTALLDKHLSNDEQLSPFERKRNAFIRSMTLSPTEATAVSFLSRKPATEVSSGQFLTYNAMLSHPFSTGSTHITSSDPSVKPKILFDYYSNPLDLEIHARNMQVLEKIANTEPLASYKLPGGRHLPAEYKLGDIESAKEICRAYPTTNYHPCGTCALGAVVDSRLKVKGVKNLRIIDGSVIPLVPRGNIITTVFAIAERGADIISEDLGIQRRT